MTIGDRIKSRREQLHMSQEELAVKIGYKSRSSVNKIELNQYNLKQSKIKLIADALETTPSYIMGWEETVSVSSPKTPSAKDIIIAEYGAVVFDSVKLFIQLDSIDQGSILERMRMFLEQDKYSRQKGVLDA